MSDEEEKYETVHRTLKSQNKQLCRDVKKKLKKAG